MFNLKFVLASLMNQENVQTWDWNYECRKTCWSDIFTLIPIRMSFSRCLGSSVRAALSSKSNNAHTTSNGALSSSGPGVTESCLHHTCTTNSINSSVCSRDLRVLDGYDDEYGGFVVDPDKLPTNQNTFSLMLRSSLSHWKMKVMCLLMQ